MCLAGCLAFEFIFVEVVLDNKTNLAAMPPIGGHRSFQQFNLQLLYFIRIILMAFIHLYHLKPALLFLCLNFSLELKLNFVYLTLTHPFCQIILHFVLIPGPFHL